MKRIISFLVSLVMIMGAIPNVYGAEEYTNIAPKATLTPLTLRTSNDHLKVTDGVKNVAKHADGWQVRKESYIKFEFGQEETFNRIDIYEINTSKVQRLKGYSIGISEDGTKWKTIASLSTDNLTCNEVVDETHFKGVIEFEKVKAKHLKVTVLKAEDPSGDENKNIGYVEEIEIFDTKPKEAAKSVSDAKEVSSGNSVSPEGYVNIAPNAVLTPLTLRSSKDHLKVNDGIKDVAKHGDGWQVRKESYIKFDFGEMVSFDRIDIYEVNTTKVQRLKGYSVDVSQNGQEWENIVSAGVENNTCPDPVDATHFKGTITFDKIKVRFLKVTILKAEDPSGNDNKNIGYVEEIEIFDTKPNEEGRVIEGSTEVILPDEIVTQIKSLDYSEIMESEANWIKEQQINMPGSPIDGAIVRNKSHSTTLTGTDKKFWVVEPYFSTLCCLGILDVATEENINVVKKWVDWYIRHINREPDKYGIAGTIYTRRVNCNDPNDYWSTDDYSASDSRGTTFLILLKKLYDVSGDKQFFIDRKADIELILNSSIATMKEDGLCEAKNQEGHYTKYLQDNIQVLMGLRAIAYLERNVLADTQKADHYDALAKKSEAGIEGMWMEDRQEYIYYITPNKTRLCDWTVFYGDAASEVFPIMYDALSPDTERAKLLYDRFNAEQPGRIARLNDTEFPWMATGIISGKMNDFLRANEQLAAMKEKYMDSGRHWTWYVFESGNAIRAAKETRDRLNLALNKKATVNGIEASALNDGNLGTLLKASTIDIDLGEAKNVNRAILKGGISYNLYYSQDGVNYQSLLTSNADVCNFNKVNARYFRFEIPAGADLKEAELYYEPINLFDKKLISSSSEVEKNLRANDNSAVTRWLSKSGENPWVTIDMGVEAEIDTVEILWDYNNMPKTFGIYLSNDGVNFEKAATYENKRGTSVTSFPLKTARFVKIMDEDDKTAAVGIYEIRGYNHSGSQIIVDNDLYKIYVDREKISFDADPLMLNDRLLVPFRAICEALSMNVGWNDQTQTVTAEKDGILIEMVIGNADIKVNGNITKSDVAPTLHNSRTLVPLRFLAEAIGCDVGWDGETNTVTITSN